MIVNQMRRMLGSRRDRAFAINSLQGWTKTDPSGVVSAETPGSPDGCAFTMANPGLGLDLPNTGAFYTTPVIYDTMGRSLAPSFSGLDYMLGWQLMERTISFTGSPGHVRIAVGWCDAATPTTCTNSIMFGIDYPDVTPSLKRRVLEIHCTALNTWAASAPITTAGLLTCAGVDGSVRRTNNVNVSDRTGLPLGTTGALINPSTNLIQVAGAVAAGPWAYACVFVGWDAAGGTAGDSGVWAPKLWAAPFTGRG